MRGGRMLTTDNYECTWGLFKSIPSSPIRKNSVRRNHEFNEQVKANSWRDLWMGIVPLSMSLPWDSP